MFVRSQLNGKEGDGGALPTRIKGEKREREAQLSAAEGGVKAAAAGVRSRFHGSECLSKVGERLRSMGRERAACCAAANDISNNISNNGSHVMQRLQRSARSLVSRTFVRFFFLP